MSSANMQNSKPIQEMRHVLGRVAAVAQHAREAGELVGGFGRHRGAGHARLQAIGGMEHRVEDLPRFEIGQLLDVEAIDALHRIGEVGMHLDRLQVRHHQQRRILQRVGVHLQLLVRLRQAALRALGFPAEMAALPDIGPALAAAGLAGAVFVGEPGVFRVGLARRRVPDQPAQVLEERLRIAALVAAAFPLRDEFVRGHGTSCRGGA
jgi:hypothetical protein